MDKEVIKDALNQASNMYPYEVIGEPDTYSLYNAGWQDAIDYLSQLLGVDIDTADFQVIMVIDVLGSQAHSDCVNRYVVSGGYLRMPFFYAV